MKRRAEQPHSMAGQFARDYLLIAVLPLFLLMVIGLAGARTVENYVGDLIEQSIDDLNSEANAQVRRLGETIIQTKARDVAKQIGIYLASSSAASMEGLQADVAFRDIALQQVGTTGYSCVYEAGSGIMRVHPNPRLVDLPMQTLASQLPAWWRIFESSLAGVEVSGYYDWQEPNGDIRQKYMTMTPVPGSFDGKVLMIAATTYIDEFSAPILAIENRADKLTGQYRRFVSRRRLLSQTAAMGILVLTFGGVYLLGRRAALRYMLPIEELGKAVERVDRENWSFRATPEMLGRKDEIGSLARAFNAMSIHMQGLIDRLKQRVEELKRTQAALRESETHYHSLFEGVPVGLYRIAPDGRILDANPALVQMMGYADRESLMQRNVNDMYPDSMGRNRRKNRMEDEGTTLSNELQMCRLSGDIIWVENQSRVVRDGDGRVLYYEGSLKDITERKETEIVLRESEQRIRALYEESRKTEELYRSLLHSSADAVVMYDMEGNARYVSPVFTEMFGWSLDEIRGQRIPFVPESEKEGTWRIIAGLIEKGTPCHGYETKRHTRDGRVIDVSISASRYNDHEGNPLGMLVMLRDISDRNKLMAQLRHAERMEAIGTLAGGIAHDFNNLMMGIQGNVSLMLQDTSRDHPHYRKLRSIENLIQSGAQLTSRLLGYARKGQYETRTLDMNRLIRESAETFRRTKREISLHLQLQPELHAITADPVQIEQVLMNLYINAADAMPKGGDLYISSEDTNHRRMLQKPYDPKPGKYVHLAVRDTGCGIEDELLDRIFDPFFTTKEMGRGTGLGLASVYGIVKAHGGYIDVASVNGEGTTFHIYLPSSDQALRPQEDAARDMNTGKGCILLVDDEPTILEIGVDLLEAVGYDVIPASDGSEALEIYSKRSEWIDLVILDLIMPVMGGGEVFDRLREIDPEVRVLLSSGYSVDGQAREILDRGCNGFIQKPFTLQQISSKILSILNGAEPSRFNPGSIPS
ncbi:MAG: PAS domain S-box protein [Desulfobacteraceae bacterium]|nr:PAS domain S-box protein [Desulfobacteraceae bacterium]